MVSDGLKVVARNRPLDISCAAVSVYLANKEVDKIHFSFSMRQNENQYFSNKMNDKKTEL